MDASSKKFFEQLLLTPRPSGFEYWVQEIVRDYLTPFADQISTDRHGNLIAVKNREAPLRVMLDGHCDQIGMLISHIDDTGFVYAHTIGGWDPQQLIGQRMNVWTRNAKLNAVIARKPIHLLTDQETKQAVKTHDLWLDLGVSSREEAAALVEIGDPVTLELGMRELQGDRVCGPGMDNATGLWSVVESFRRVCEDSRELDCAVYCVSTVQEEIGLRGARTSAFAVDPHVAIAVDVTHATDCPTIDKKRYGDVSLGGGPVVFRGPNMNPTVVERIQQAAEARNIPIQPAAAGRATPNDANSLQINRGGVATGLISIPNRYMHSAVETIALGDIDHCANLLSEFMLRVSRDDTFVPGEGLPSSQPPA